LVGTGKWIGPGVWLGTLDRPVALEVDITTGLGPAKFSKEWNDAVEPPLTKKNNIRIGQLRIVQPEKKRPEWHEKHGHSPECAHTEGRAEEQDTPDEHGQDRRSEEKFGNLNGHVPLLSRNGARCQAAEPLPSTANHESVHRVRRFQATHTPEKDRAKAAKPAKG
jgi:hypothetical protein